MSGGGLGAVAAELVGDIAPGKRGSAGEQKIEGAAEGADVALLAGRTTVSGLLGGHVVHGPNRRPLARHTFVFTLGVECQAQIDDLLTCLEGVINRFAGLMSRWITPRLAAYCNPVATDRIAATASLSGKGPRCRT